MGVGGDERQREGRLRGGPAARLPRRPADRRRLQQPVPVRKLGRHQAPPGAPAASLPAARHTAHLRAEAAVRGRARACGSRGCPFSSRGFVLHGSDCAPRPLRRAPRTTGTTCRTSPARCTRRRLWRSARPSWWRSGTTCAARRARLRRALVCAGPLRRCLAALPLPRPARRRGHPARAPAAPSHARHARSRPPPSLPRAALRKPYIPWRSRSLPPLTLRTAPHRRPWSRWPRSWTTARTAT